MGEYGVILASWAVSVAIGMVEVPLNESEAAVEASCAGAVIVMAGEPVNNAETAMEVEKPVYMVMIELRISASKKSG